MKTVTLIGAGRVATHLGKGLKSAGLNIAEVISKNGASARELATLLDANPIENWEDLSPTSDLYLVAVNDDAVAEVANSFPFNDCFIAHTSGSVPMNALEQASTRFGIFYPLQTFSKEKEVDLNKVPFCIEGNTEENAQALFQLAQRVSGNVNYINSEERKRLHLAAVFACNFSNHLYAIAEELLQEQGLTLDLLRPLLIETAAKAQQHAPKDVQTGPAVRDDKAVLASHLKQLEAKSDYQKLYNLLTKSIQDKHNEA